MTEEEIKVLAELVKAKQLLAQSVRQLSKQTCSSSDDCSCYYWKLNACDCEDCCC